MTNPNPTPTTPDRDALARAEAAKLAALLTRSATDGE